MEQDKDILVEIEGESPAQEEKSEVKEEAAEELLVEVVDDTPEEDRKHKRRPEGVEPDIPSDEEIKSYSEGVQKRIKKLKYEFHEERRAKEELQRQLQEALKVTSQTIRQHEEMRKRYQEGETTLVKQAAGRVDSEMAQAKLLYKQAFEAGDADKLAEAQERIAALAAEKRDISTYRPVEIPAIEAPQPRPQVDYKTQEWASRNPWFMQDRDMTNYALVLDERLKREGISPQSDEYFSRLDAGMKREFPNRFAREEKVSSSEGVVSPPKKQGNVVAPASRTQANSPRRITLTKTQVELARRLGITPEGYARQLMALNKGNE